MAALSPNDLICRDFLVGEVGTAWGGGGFAVGTLAENLPGDLLEGLVGHGGGRLGQGLAAAGKGAGGQCDGQRRCECGGRDGSDGMLHVVSEWGVTGSWCRGYLLGRPDGR